MSKFILPGILLGLTLYTYQASRVFDYLRRLRAISSSPSSTAVQTGLARADRLRSRRRNRRRAARDLLTVVNPAAEGACPT
jgi:hypothetical protein